VGWYDINSKNWGAMQSVQASNAIVNGNSITYPNSFYGINISYTYWKRELKEVVTISEDTKTYIQNNYPNIPSPETKWFVVANRLKLINVNMTKNGQNVIENSTIEGGLEFSDIADDLKFFFPLGWAWDSDKNESCELDNTSCFDVKWRIIKQGGNWYVLYGIPLNWFQNKTFPIYIDPTTTYVINYSNVNLASYCGVICNYADAINIPYSGHTSYTEAHYDNLNASDNSKNQWGSVQGGTDTWMGQLYNFTINEDIGDITSLFVEWEGYDELSEGGNFTLYIWNDTSDSWITINATVSGESSDILYGTTFDSSYNFSELMHPTTKELFLKVVGDKTIKASCPYVYSWNGSDWIFDSETFLWANTKQWEGNTNARLESLNPFREENGLDIYKIKIAEELSEDVYFDKVQLIAIDHPKNTEVYVDTATNYYTIKKLEEPLSCVDECGKSCIDIVKEKDEVVWNMKPDKRKNYNEDLDGDGLSDSTNRTDYFSEIILEFERKGDYAKILHATRKKGEESDDFARETIGIVGFNNMVEYLYIGKGQEWIDYVQEIFLHMYLWNGTGWEDLHFVSEAWASEKASDMVVPVNLSGINTPTVRIKYESLMGMGGPDYVGIDWSKDRPIERTVLNVTSATFFINGKEHDVTNKLLDDDSDYVEFSKGDYGYIDFEGIEPTKKERTFFIEDNGYYEALEYILHYALNVTLTEERKALIEKIMTNMSFSMRYLGTRIYNHHSIYEDFVQVQVTTTPAGDTCDTCNIDCTEECTVDSNLECQSGFNATGVGVITIEAQINITGAYANTSMGCYRNCTSGRCFV